MRKESVILVGDFETTTGDVTHTEVWSSAFGELYKDEVAVFTSIERGWKYLLSYNSSLVIYYHNLKFDGMFWLNFIIKELKFTYTKEKKLKNKEFSILISEMGVWYNLKVKVDNKTFEFRDSYKLFPLKLADLGKAFNTKHRKLDMNYDDIKHKDTPISEDKMKYIKNDILVLKEVMEYAIEHDMTKLTIGACCIQEYKKSFYRREDFDNIFPNLREMDSPVDGVDLDNYCRKSYKGGWCYLNEKYKSKLLHNGCTMDVNSLYPSVMLDENCVYPNGNPTRFFKNEIPIDLEKNEKYIVRIRTYFKLRKNKLPCIQIKNSVFYKSTEWLKSSDVVIKGRKILGFDGNSIKPELTLTQMDFELIRENYILEDCEILDGVCFQCHNGLFTEYLDKYRKIKENNTGALRTIAKLYSNNLYGQFGKNRNSTYKVPYEDDKGIIKFETIHEENKRTLFVPVASFITSYARCKTIRAAQVNIHKFIYADTDSIHCLGKEEDLKGIEIHDKKYGAWKCESEWKNGYFVRQKTYIEESEKEIDIKCAGLTAFCKELFAMSYYQDYTEEEFNCLDYEEKEFVKVKRELNDFDEGLLIPSKLYSINTDGGIVLKKDYFNMR